MTRSVGKRVQRNREEQERRTAMQLVEQHVIRHCNPRYAAIDRAAFASKNLYNAANYLVRQAFLHEAFLYAAFLQAGVYLDISAVYHRLEGHVAHSALPRKVSNDVLRQLTRDWQAFFAARDTGK